MNDLEDHMEGMADTRYIGLWRILFERARTWEGKNEEPIGDAGPAEMLAFFMGQHGLNQSDLERLGLIPCTLTSKILAGERQISKAAAKRLAAHFGISAEVFF